MGDCASFFYFEVGRSFWDRRGYCIYLEVYFKHLVLLLDPEGVLR